ncbi:hypothetical protein NLJ89_g2272 [Agrocybe chaxingu]|uniref:Mitochondrial import inner membrane translocase subunit TIM16 n=1 Tax=Agrocybe chaxingu TaxID=84603 RepID=A0A9W8MWM2_9AGAR|nr:hypothetical protein NLJ89_g2272 [Agrocybe chaxingu]
MASPRAIVQIFIAGSRILGKAFLEAGKQAVKNAKSAPQAAIGHDAAGVGHANSGSVTDQLTRQHRMTLDEAQLILNVKKSDLMKQITKNHQHLFKANSPPPKPEKPLTAKQMPPFHSHYLQSKVVRALERIEAEMKATQPEAVEVEPKSHAPEASTPPPDPPSGKGV